MLPGRPSPSSEGPAAALRVTSLCGLVDRLCIYGNIILEHFMWDTYVHYTKSKQQFPKRSGYGTCKILTFERY